VIKEKEVKKAIQIAVRASRRLPKMLMAIPSRLLSPLRARVIGADRGPTADGGRRYGRAMKAMVIAMQPGRICRGEVGRGRLLLLWMVDGMRGG
jgi:hypothetical protein